MKRGLIDFFVHGQSFRRDFRKQLKTLIIVGAGFTIAFTWRQTIFDISQSIVKFFTNIQSSSMLSLTTSILTTLISLLAVSLAIYFLKDPNGEF